MFNAVKLFFFLFFSFECVNMEDGNDGVIRSVYRSIRPLLMDKKRSLKLMIYHVPCVQYFFLYFFEIF